MRRVHGRVSVNCGDVPSSQYHVVVERGPPGKRIKKYQTLHRVSASESKTNFIINLVMQKTLIFPEVHEFRYQFGNAKTLIFPEVHEFHYQFGKAKTLIFPEVHEFRYQFGKAKTLIFPEVHEFRYQFGNAKNFDFSGSSRISLSIW